METNEWEYAVKHTKILSRLLQIGINGNIHYIQIMNSFLSLAFPDYFKSELMETHIQRFSHSGERDFPDYFKSELMETRG